MNPEPIERLPFDMDCQKCEYQPVCFLPLRVVHKLTRQWFQLCRQGGHHNDIIVTVERKMQGVLA